MGSKAHKWRSWDAYFERLAAAKARNPEIGKQYDEALKELLAQEYYCDTHFNLLRGNGDWEGAIKFKDEIIAPLKKRYGDLFDQLMSPVKKRTQERGATNGAEDAVRPGNADGG